MLILGYIPTSIIMSILKAIKRNNTSTGANNKLRSEGFVPAILYGGKDANLNISIEKIGTWTGALPALPALPAFGALPSNCGRPLYTWCHGKFDDAKVL